MNKRNIIIAVIILAALLIYPFRARISQAFHPDETGAEAVEIVEAATARGAFPHVHMT